MNEEERAGWLARAVDKLIQRHPAQPPSAETGDRELDDLLLLARARLDLAGSTALHGSRYEESIWHKILGRLEGPEQPSASMPTGAEPRVWQDIRGTIYPHVTEQQLEELEQVAALRQHMSARMMALAESHREAVWKTIEARLAARNSKKGILGFFRRGGRETRLIGSPVSGLVPGQTLWQSPESHTDELIELARKRRVLGLMSQHASAGAERRIWSRLAQTGHAALPSRARLSLGWQRLAVGVATLALMVAALGPIPKTGLAGHPFAHFIEAVGDHVGVSESGAPPVDAGASRVLEGTTVTAAEASHLLGAQVSYPVEMPAGYHLTASMYYPAGLTTDSGTFLRSYMSGTAALLLFQEAASCSDLAVADGAAQDVTLPDGTPATLFAGGWIPGASGFTWTTAGGQTLVFDRGGLRTVIQFTGGDAMAPDLLAIASTLK